MLRLLYACSAALLVAVGGLPGCASSPSGEQTSAVPGPAAPSLPSRPGASDLSAAQGRVLISQFLAATTSDRALWATDIFAAFAAMEIAPIPENICAVIAVTEQESSFRVDPPVPGLSKIAWREIERQREQSGVPGLVLDAALALPSPSGKSYKERLDAVRTERELSMIFEDFIGMVPLGRTFLANRNPVRTGGPMQVSIAFAESHVAARPYPYPITTSVRHEIFSRRGGMYFGIAHLLDYVAPYDDYLYRYADFNAGQYASRNAAFQAAVTHVAGIPLVLDGDLLRYEDGRPAAEPGATELAVRVLARRLKITTAQARRDLELEKTPEFGSTLVYRRVFDMADELGGRVLPRAVVPRIDLKSPKFTRKLTTRWFAQRVSDRHRACLARGMAL